MKKNVLLYILAIIVILTCCIGTCVGVLVVTGVGGVFKAFSQKFEGANKNIKAICTEVNKDNYNDAYELMSSDYQKFHNLFEFKTFADSKLDGCTEMDGKNTSLSQNGNNLSITTKLEFNDNSKKQGTFDFVKENNEWRLDNTNL